MLRRSFILLLLLFAVTPVVTSQTISKGIVSAFEKGDARKLSKELHTNLEINLDGKLQLVSRNQAIRVLQDFFDNNPPKSFKVTHQGTKVGSLYGIGQLKTKKSTFRVNLYFIKVDASNLIYNITIEKV